MASYKDFGLKTCAVGVKEFPHGIIFNEGRAEKTSCEKHHVHYLNDGWMLIIFEKSMHTDKLYPSSLQYPDFFSINSCIPLKILKEVMLYLSSINIHFKTINNLQDIHFKDRRLRTCALVLPELPLGFKFHVNNTKEVCSKKHKAYDLDDGWILNVYEKNNFTDQYSPHSMQYPDFFSITSCIPLKILEYIYDSHIHNSI